MTEAERASDGVQRDTTAYPDDPAVTRFVEAINESFVALAFLEGRKP